MNHKPGTCWECAKPSEGKRFCCRPCKQAWNNRRMQRGAIMYDLFMGSRFEREASRKEGVWSVLCRLASDWHDADGAAGRVGYDMHGALRRLPVATRNLAAWQAL